MIDRLKSIFRSDDFIPTASVFPGIDADKIAKEMKLADQGASRGKENQPASSVTDFDHIETGIIARIEEQRRIGLENFETNRRIYNERLARVGSVSKDVEVEAGRSKGEFGQKVQYWKNEIEGARERLFETY
jgi:hypothetical protein